MKFRSRVAALSVILLLSMFAAPRESRAQFSDRMRIAIGTRVLVRTRDWAEGKWQFERATPDTLTLRRRSRGVDEERSIPWSDAERVDTMVVGGPSAHHMLVGGASGGLLALLVAWFGSGISASHHPHDDCPGCGFIIIAPRIIYTGVFAGATLGYFQRDRHWSTAWRAANAPIPAGH